MQVKYILLTVVIILVRLPFFLSRVSYQVQVASRGRGVKREENRKFIRKEARTTSGSLTGHIREAVWLKSWFTMRTFALSRFHEKLVLFFTSSPTSKRRWYSGEHSCLPSSWPGFDSRPTQWIFFGFYSGNNCETWNLRCWSFLFFTVIRVLLQSVGGIVVSIAAFQAVDPGSIPGPRNEFFRFYSGDNCENSILRCWIFFMLSNFFFLTWQRNVNRRGSYVRVQLICSIKINR